MRYYPVNLDVCNRPCLVVGGGKVATRKTETLLACQAQVKVVSPDAGTRLRELASGGRISLALRPYAAGDLEGIFLVIGATGDRHLSQRLHSDARRAGCLCNIADRPELCDFILPAVVQQGDLVIAISTSGRSPAFARYLRRKLAKEFGPEYARFLQLMGAIRRQLLARDDDPQGHREIFTRLIREDLPGLIQRNDIPGIDKLLKNVLGPGFTYRRLMAAARK